jgi:ERCC4-type nuclease
MRILIDDREDKVHNMVMNFIQELHPECEKVRLELGDIITDKVLIERKSYDDFYSSIMDGRLDDQLNRLSREQDKLGKVVVLMVHGWHSDNPRFDRDIFEGAMASSLVRYGIPIIWVSDLATLCRMAVKVCTKVDEGKWLLARKVWKKTYSKAPEIVQRTRRFFGVPEKVATQMIIEFGTIL